MPQEKREFARVGFVDIFLEMATDDFLEYSKTKKQLELIKSQGGEYIDNMFVYKKMDEFIECEHKLDSLTIKIIVFLSCYLEAYINDFACIVLGDSYAKKHLDKLDLLSKWIIIPRLITSQQIDKSNSYFAKMQELIKWRNDLIHSKTKDAFSFLKNVQNIELKSFYNNVDLLDYFDMLKLLFEALDSIDEKGSHKFRLDWYMKRIENAT